MTLTISCNTWDSVIADGLKSKTNKTTKHYKMRTNPSILLRQGVSQCGVSLFPVQDLALSTDEALPVYNRCAVHALVAAYLNLICQLTTVPAFCQHIHEVCV